MRRMKSSPIFLLMESRESEMLPVVARRAGRGVVAVMVVERRSSKREVWGNGKGLVEVKVRRKTKRID